MNVRDEDKMESDRWTEPVSDEETDGPYGLFSTQVFSIVHVLLYVCDIL